MAVTITNNTQPGKNIRVRVTATDEVVPNPVVANQQGRTDEAFHNIAFGRALWWDRANEQVAFVKRSDNGQTEIHHVANDEALVIS